MRDSLLKREKRGIEEWSMMKVDYERV